MTMLMRWLGAVGPSGLLFVGACQAPGPGLGREALSPPERDTLAAWPGVGELTTGRNGGCSGTLVHLEGDRGLVLTAAHCVFDIYVEHGFYGLAPRAFRFGPGEDVEATIGRVGIHPRYGWDRRASDTDPGPGTSRDDLAVVEVNGLPPEAAGWVLPIADEDVALATGDAVTLVGFGRPDRGFRQVGGNVVGALETLTVHGARIIQTLASAGVVPCPGDSGGPIVVDTPAGARVIGVHSSSTGGACGDSGLAAFAMDAREALALVESIATADRPPTPETCAACAATTGICRDTRAALVSSLASDWEACIAGRGPSDDFETCSASSPTIRTAYDAHWSCLQTTCGAEVCTDVSRIFTLCEYSLDGGSACDTCITASCCDLTAACMNDSSCRACANTTTPDAACRANTTLQAMYACLGETCEAACGEYVADLVAQVVPPVMGGADAGGADAGGADASSAVDGSTTPSAPSSGCSCRARPASSASSLGMMLALAAVLGARRRRR